jgi:hypothetical protein
MYVCDSIACRIALEMIVSLATYSFSARLDCQLAPCASALLLLEIGGMSSEISRDALGSLPRCAWRLARKRRVRALSKSKKSTHTFWKVRPCFGTYLKWTLLSLHLLDGTTCGCHRWHKICVSPTSESAYRTATCFTWIVDVQMSCYSNFISQSIAFLLWHISRNGYLY